MSQPSRLEIAVRRIRPDEEEPDRLPLRWSTIARLLSFTEAHRGQRNALLWLCAFRAMALPMLAWIVGHIIKGPITAGDGVATAERVCAAAAAQWNAAIDELDLVAAAGVPMALLREVDAFINRTEPFKIAKDPSRTAELAGILAQCAETVRIAGVMLEPFLPEKMAQLRAALGELCNGLANLRKRAL